VQQQSTAGQASSGTRRFPAELLAELRRRPLEDAEVRRGVEVARRDHLLHMELRKLPQKLTFFLLTCLTLGVHASAPWDIFSPSSNPVAPPYHKT
jgi:hypothetical protein